MTVACDRKKRLNLHSLGTHDKPLDLLNESHKGHHKQVWIVERSVEYVESSDSFTFFRLIFSFVTL